MGTSSLIHGSSSSGKPGGLTSTSPGVARAAMAHLGDLVQGHEVVHLAYPCRVASYSEPPAPHPDIARCSSSFT